MTYQPKEGRAFIPFGDDQRETAIIVVGTADDYGISQREIKVVNGGLDIPAELADVIYDGDEDEPYEEDEPSDIFDPAVHDIEGVKAYVNDYPDQREAVLAAEQDGKNRVTLVQWLNETSG